MTALTAVRQIARVPSTDTFGWHGIRALDGLVGSCQRLITYIPIRRVSSGCSHAFVYLYAYLVLLARVLCGLLVVCSSALAWHLHCLFIYTVKPLLKLQSRVGDYLLGISVKYTWSTVVLHRRAVPEISTEAMIAGVGVSIHLRPA